MSIPSISPSHPLNPFSTIDEQNEYVSESFDMGTLCAHISLALLEENNPQKAASAVIIQAPDILRDIAAYQKQPFLDLFEKVAVDYENQSTMKAALLILYSNSLTNSRYRKHVEDLENCITRLTLTSTPFHAKEMIQKASRLLKEEIPSALQPIETKLTEIREVSRQIEMFLNLFDYLDVQEQIKNVAQFTRIGNDSQFPDCQTYFPILCKNLLLCKNQEGEMRALRSQLASKIVALTQHQAASYRLGQKEELPIKKKNFLTYQSELLWKVCSDLLQEAFSETLLQKKATPEFFIPQDLVNAINRASRNSQSRELSFQKLIDRNRIVISPLFVAQVWDEYLPSCDSLHLMERIIGQVSDDIFAQLQKMDGESMLKILKSEISPQSPLSFVRLKDWILQRMDQTPRIE